MQIPGLDWLEEEVKNIPGDVVNQVKNDVSSAANNAWNNIRTDIANGVNQVGSAIVTKSAGAIAPAGNKPVSIPLSSNQLIAIAIGLVLLVGVTLWLVLRR